MKLVALILLVASSYVVKAQCPAPTGLATSGITATAATATWSPVSGALSYNVDYRPPGYDWITIANATTSLQWGLYGMEANTTYDWRVRANCSSGPGNYTQAQFTTLGVGSCSPPGGLFASNITSSTATVNWSAVSGAFAYSVYYKPSSSSVWITAASATYATSYNLYALSSNTTYDWMVYSNCSLTETSTWSTSQLTTSGSGGGSTPGSSACPGPSDVSTNGTMGGAASISLNTDVKGTVAPKNDIDYYKFTIGGEGTIAVGLTTLPANYNLAVLNSNGTQLGVSQNNGTQNERVNLSVTPGTYYAKVYPKGNANSATSCYTLRVQTVTASRVIATEAGASAVASEVNMKSVFAVNLYPNPAGDQLNVSVEGFDKGEIKVYNLMGKLVMQQGLGNSITQINISKLPAGMYLLNVNNGREVRSAKFVKQ